MKLFHKKNNPIKRGLQKFLSIITGHNAPTAKPDPRQNTSHVSSHVGFDGQQFNQRTETQARPGHLRTHKQYTLHDIGLAGEIHHQIVGSVSQEGGVRYRQQRIQSKPQERTSNEELIDETAAKLSNIGLAGIKKQNRRFK